MLRRKAVVHLLLEDVCGLAGVASTGTEEAAREPDSQLHKAWRRAALIVAFDWLALSILFFFRSSRGPWLDLGAGEESLFTLGVIAVAIHSGFRLAQLYTLRSVQRVIDGLDDLNPGC